MKYTWVVIVLIAAGCYSPVELEQAKAEHASAVAQQVAAEQETARFAILSDAAQPVYWPFVLALGCVLLVVYMGHRAQLAQVGMLTGNAPVNVRLLPGDAGFERALLDYAREKGGRARRGRQSGSYYLEVDGQREKVRALTWEG